jgi:F-type H+-transporting ATPase subunit b
MHALALLTSVPLASGNSWLITPDVGLTIWTLAVFAISLYILRKYAFPRITKALDERRESIAQTLDAADRTRHEAEQLLAEYRERLKEARAQSDEIVQRARQTADAHDKEARERGLGDLRAEVADLTIMATEKVTRKTLDDADQRRLVEEALSELDFSGLSSGAKNN